MSDRTDLAEAAIETEDEQRTVERATAMPSRLVFETIRQSGDEELRRPAMALAFSGVAAGLDRKSVV